MLTSNPLCDFIITNCLTCCNTATSQNLSRFQRWNLVIREKNVEELKKKGGGVDLYVKFYHLTRYMQYCVSQLWKVELLADASRIKHAQSIAYNICKIRINCVNINWSNIWAAQNWNHELDSYMYAKTLFAHQLKQLWIPHIAHVLRMSKNFLRGICANCIL